MKLEFSDGSLRPIGEVQMQAARALAIGAPRRRALLRYHEHAESVQRMVHAVEPDSYVRPHKHETPDKTEVFLVLAGRACICAWSDAGGLVDHVEIAADGPQRGAEIPPRTWHSLVALEPGTVLYELVEGAYDPASHKHFAPWAPPEEDRAAGAAFVAKTRAALGLASD